MLTIGEAFNIVKKERKFLGDIENYQIKISSSDNFERENLIGIYKIRAYNTLRNENHKLSQEINNLILGLENYSGNKLKFVSISGEKYYGIFYLSQNFEKVIAFLENEFDDN